MTFFEKPESTPEIEIQKTMFSADEQLAFLQYVILRNFIPANEKSPPPNTFFALKAKPLHNKIAITLNNIPVMKLKDYSSVLQELWENFASTMREELNVDGINQNQKRPRVEEVIQNEWRIVAAVSCLQQSENGSFQHPKNL